MTVAELAVLLSFRTEGFSEASRAIGSVRRGALALAAIRFGENLIEGAAKAGTEITKMSQAMGMSAAQTQEYGYISEQSGSNIKQLAVGVGMYERNLRAFVQGRGSKDFIASMNEVGLSSEDAAKALASPEGLDHSLNKIADRFHAMGNTAERAALSTSLFNARAGRTMVSDLSKGSAALEEMRKHFRDLGGELSNDQVDALKTVNTSFIDLQVALKGLGYQIVAALAPLIRGLVVLIEALAKAMHVLVEGTQWLSKHWEVMTAVGATLITMFIMLRGASIAAAAAAIASWAIAAAPLILMGVIIMALILVVNDLWVGFNGGRSVIFDLWDAMRQWAKGSDSIFAQIIKGVDFLLYKLGLVSREIKAFLHLGDLKDADKKMEKAHEDMTYEGQRYNYALGQYLDARAHGNKPAQDLWYAQMTTEAGRAQTIKKDVDRTEKRRDYLRAENGDPDDDSPYYTPGAHTNYEGYRPTSMDPVGAGGSDVQVHGPVAINVYPPAGSSPREIALHVKHELASTARNLGGTTRGAKVRQ